MADPLQSARLKVERARQHVKAVRDETRAFVDSNPYRTFVEPDPDTGEPVVRIGYARPNIRVPLRLGLLAGDAIHNLRSALDHLAWQLATIGTGPGHRTQFPIFDDSDSYRRQQPELLKGIDPRYWARIEAVQPYHVRRLIDDGGSLTGYHDPLITNLYLMPIGRLDNADKHRLLLATVGVAAWSEPKFEGVKRATGTYPGAWVRMDEGAELFRVTEWEMLPGATEVKVNHSPTFTILIGDPEYDVAAPWSDRTKAAVSAADLNRAAECVLGVIDSFAPEFV